MSVAGVADFGEAISDGFTARGYSNAKSELDALMKPPPAPKSGDYYTELMAHYAVSEYCREALASVDSLAGNNNLSARLFRKGFNEEQLRHILGEIDRSETINVTNTEKPEHTFFETCRRVNRLIEGCVHVIKKDETVIEHPRIPKIKVVHIKNGDKPPVELQFDIQQEDPQIHTPRHLVISAPPEEGGGSLYFDLSMIAQGYDPTVIIYDLSEQVEAYVTKRRVFPQLQNQYRDHLRDEILDGLAKLDARVSPGIIEYRTGRVSVDNGRKQTYFKPFGQVGYPHAVGFLVTYDFEEKGLHVTPYIAMNEKVGDEVLERKFFGKAFTLESATPLGTIVSIDTLKNATPNSQREQVLPDRQTTPINRKPRPV